jgi:hypothetical protein
LRQAIVGKKGRYRERKGVFMRYTVSGPSHLFSGLIAQSEIAQLLDELYFYSLLVDPRASEKSPKRQRGAGLYQA